MLTPMFAALLLVQAAAPPKAWTLDPARTAVRYEVIHKLHKVEGTSKKVEGRAVEADGGRVMTMLRVAVATFESGDANRDAHMQEVLDVGKFPFVTFKGVTQLQGGALPARSELSIQGELDMHGVKKAITVPVAVESTPDGVHVTGSFPVSLDEHKIERPSLLFVKVDDACTIALDLWLKEDKR
jgi:polyisoprenoid-binding protein YceI